MSLLGKEESKEDSGNKHFFDAAALLGSLLRSTTLSGTEGEQQMKIILDHDSSANSDSVEGNSSSDDQLSNHSNILVDIEPYFDNERGEEMIRASLTSFFLDLYGDMG